MVKLSLPFKAGDKFVIPESNGVISFASSGNYSQATLENGAWHFINLRLNRSSLLANFTVSARNTNVTIISYTSRNGTYPSIALRFSLSGEGTFNVNFGRQMNMTRTSEIVDWFVSSNGLVMGLGDRWNLLPNGTVAIHGITGTATISYTSTYENVQARVANLSFYDQHSVVIVTAAMAGLTLVVAVAIKVKLRQSEEKQAEAQRAKLAKAFEDVNKRRT